MLPISIGRIGTTITSFYMPDLYQKDQSFKYPMIFLNIMCIFSLICALITYLIDKKLKIDNEKPYDFEIKNIPIAIKRAPYFFWLCLAFAILGYMALFSLLINT